MNGAELESIVAQNAPLAAFVTDGGGKILFHNGLFKTMFGARASVGADVDALFTEFLSGPNDVKLFANAVAVMVAGHGPAILTRYWTLLPSGKVGTVGYVVPAAPAEAISAIVSQDCADDSDVDASEALLECAPNLTSAAGWYDDLTPVMPDAAPERRYSRHVALQEELRKAIFRDQIQPFFQPIVDPESKRVVGAEVLARWEHPRLGSVKPTEFVAAAESAGLLFEFERALLDRACNESFGWMEANQLEWISFNTTAKGLAHPAFANQLLTRLSHHGVAPDRICLEVVENSLTENHDAVVANINPLSDAGVSIALDDYGLGLSNLRTLLNLPLDRLKIDRSLIRGIEHEERTRDVLSSISQLGEALGVSLVAEGIETDAQSEVIEDVGVGFMQGFKFGRPMDAAAFDFWLCDQNMQAAPQVRATS